MEAYFYKYTKMNVIYTIFYKDLNFNKFILYFKIQKLLI